jgi:sec-independent protein translocase protein TatA
MGSFSIWHWIIVIAVVLLLFGRGKISELMGDVAQGIKAFKKGMSEDEVAKTDAAPKTIDQTATPPAPAATAQPQAEPRKAG